MDSAGRHLVPGGRRNVQCFRHQSSLKYFLTNKDSVVIALPPGAGPEMDTKYTSDLRRILQAGFGTNFILYKIVFRINLCPKGAKPKLKISNDFWPKSANIFNNPLCKRLQ